MLRCLNLFQSFDIQFLYFVVTEAECNYSDFSYFYCSFKQLILIVCDYDFVLWLFMIVTLYCDCDCDFVFYFSTDSNTNLSGHYNNIQLHSIYWYPKLFTTVVEGDPKAPFSVATTPRCRGGRYSFPLIAPLYPWYILL